MDILIPVLWAIAPFPVLWAITSFMDILIPVLWAIAIIGSIGIAFLFTLLIAAFFKGGS